MKSRYVPLAKRTKKARQEAHREKRALWPIPPVTKRIESKKLYNRKKRASEGPPHWPDAHLPFWRCSGGGAVV